MLRSRAFWIVFAAAALLGGVLGLRAMPRAFPVLRLELDMDREGALRAARSLDERYALGPESYRQAASFGRSDAIAQTYFELEGGGPDVLARLQADGLYSPYLWFVRHFRPGETREASLSFTPAGAPYGFRLRLPEDEPGAALDAAAARAIAEAGAREEWGVDLGAYTLVETAQETRPGGRIDHGFVYERTGVEVGEARFRLRLGVAGSRFSELSHFVHTPEAFGRRYREMRSANETVAIITALLMVLTLVIGGVGGGVFYLMRRRAAVWRPALIWGLAIAALLALSTVNALPLQWMGYDTATGERGFLLQQFLVAALILVFGAPMLGVIFAAAEGLTRRAFPQQLQQWRLWQRDVGNSDPALGRTLGGLLLAPVSIAYVVGFYLFVARPLGWWAPAEALVQPDLLATYAPWLTGVSLSLFAAAWEESVFRAVPIAIAALVGRRYGRTGLWIAVALIGQALLFAASHADYPQQPAYARVVELFLPAVGWGLVYLAFGLVPVVLAHFAYNLTWFSVPLFVATAPGLWVDRVIVILIALAPLAVVLVMRMRHGARRDAPEWAYNAAWRPPADAEADREVETAREAGREAMPATHGLPGGAATTMPGAVAPERVDADAYRTEPSSRLRHALVAAALLGVAAWALSTSFRYDVPGLSIMRDEALGRAEVELAAHGYELDEDWRRLRTVGGGPGEAHRFVWRTAGEDAYAELLGTHLWPPHWRVRIARFTGDVEERAEEYRVVVGPTGSVLRVERRLPEARAGESLEEDEARVLAGAAVRDRFGLEPAGLREVSAVAHQRPARRDWVFTFADPEVYPLELGEPRLSVEVAGAEVVDAYRFVHVPEEWQRAERSRRQVASILEIFGGIGMLLIFGAALASGVVLWTRHRYRPKVFLVVSGALGIVLLVTGLNGFESLLADLDTAQPFELQLAVLVGGGAFALALVAAALGLVAGFVHAWRPVRPAPPVPPLPAGLALGAALAGASALIALLSPGSTPSWPPVGAAESALPLLASALDPLVEYLTHALLLMLMLIAGERWTDGWRRRRLLGAMLAVLAGVFVFNPGSLFDIGGWLAAGVFMAAVLLALFDAVRRLHLAVVPGIAAAIALLDLAPSLLVPPFPGAAVGALLAMLLILGAAWFWTEKV